MKLSTILTALAIGAGIVITYTVIRERGASAKIEQAKAEADSIGALADSLRGSLDTWKRIAEENAIALAKEQDSIVYITRTRLRVDTIQLAPPDGGPSVPIAVVAKTAYDRLAERCNALSGACTTALASKDSALSKAVLVGAAEHDRADRLKGALDRVKPPRKWGLGCSGGYGATLHNGVVVADPAVACGLTVRVW